jgi:putative ABC transport system ATP-binding protein
MSTDLRSRYPLGSAAAEHLLVEARDLGRRHPDGQGWLFEQASLRLAPGDRLALSGPSGSGKTLLLRALALLDPVDCGEVLWQGRPVHGQQVTEYRSQVMYLHQRPAFFEDQVEASIRAPFALRVHHGRRYDHQQVLAWLGQLGRDTSFLAKPMRNLSGGEMQIVALVRALALEPKVLLLDEPTAALDEATGLAVEALIRTWTQQDPSRSLIWVSHDQGIQQRATNRTIRIVAGRILED